MCEKKYLRELLERRASVARRGNQVLLERLDLMHLVQQVSKFSSIFSEFFSFLYHRTEKHGGELLNVRCCGFICPTQVPMAFPSPLVDGELGTR